ncbi:MAG: STAS domain-containing protein [Anaerolineae bacterium]|nr:STAS domain-containing protein [Anaerolineae bacterium]
MELIDRRENDVRILQLSGRFDTYTADSVRRWIESNTDAPPAQIVVNLQDVSFVDSTGLATLVQGMKRSRQHGGDLLLCHLQQPVRLIFELTRLDRAFEVLPTEEDAVAAFNTPQTQQATA